MDYTTLMDYAQDGLIGIAVILMGMIKVPKIEINLWSFLIRKIGNAMNYDLNKRIDKLTKDFEEHLEEEEKEKVRASRYRILRCEGELRRNMTYTKEAFDELLRDIDYYNQYCNEHPDYENSKAVKAIEFILEEYGLYLKENKFLA